MALIRRKFPIKSRRTLIQIEVIDERSGLSHSGETLGFRSLEPTFALFDNMHLMSTADNDLRIQQTGIFFLGFPRWWRWWRWRRRALPDVGSRARRRLDHFKSSRSMTIKRRTRSSPNILRHSQSLWTTPCDPSTARAFSPLLLEETRIINADDVLKPPSRPAKDHRLLH